MKIGLLREGKVPPDKRVPFSPDQCVEILSKYSNISLYVQPSSIRCFSDLEYQKKGVVVAEDLSMCDVLMGVKEVPVDMLINNKMFFFFSHTIKKQPYNKELLKTIIRKKIQLVDYETLVDNNKKRIIGFGRYAGIVGCYNTLLAYGKKNKTYDLKYAHLLEDKKDLYRELLKVKLPSDIKIILTGNGRVSRGVLEILHRVNVKLISKKDFLNTSFNYPTCVQLTTSDYNERQDGSPGSKEDFYAFPDQYRSSLLKYAKYANILITGHYYASNSPVLLSVKDVQDQSFNVDVIGDISCDIAGPIAPTIRPSTIAEPIYGYNPISCMEDDYKKEGIIAVMAVDNLPCSLPKDASIDFGSVFIDSVLPDLLTDRLIVSKAMITDSGYLTDNFKYLSDYIT